MTGKKIVIVLFSTAFLLWGILFYAAWRQKQKVNRDFMHTLTSAADTATGDSGIRRILDTLPRTWTRVSWIQGQGWAIYLPCDSEPGTLQLDPDSTGRPQWQCEFCDSLGGGRIARVVRHPWTGNIAVEIDSAGDAALEHVNDTVAARFSGAPFKQLVLTWHPGGRDSLVFTPAADVGEFETLRAADENPEGCGNGP